MKKMILSCIFVSLLFNIVAQRKAPDAPPSPEKEAYLQKSKKLWKVAIIVVSVGGAMAIAGAAIASKQDIYEENNPTGGVLFITGCAVMLSSIAFSIPAGIAKRRARGISFKNEPSLQLQQGMVLTRFVPSLNLRIGLGKLRGGDNPLPQL